VTNDCHYCSGIVRVNDFKAVADTLFKAAKRKLRQRGVVEDIAAHRHHAAQQRRALSRQSLCEGPGDW